MRTSIIYVCLLLCSTISKAQDEPIDFSKVKAPSSPAFTILGTQPNEISRPKSYEELETALLSSFTDGNGLVLPDQFALEFSPFWMKSQPKLTYRQATAPNVKESILQNLSISAANGTFPSLRDTTLRNTRMGLGLRTRIDFGKAPEELRLYAALDDIQESLIGLRSSLNDPAFKTQIQTYQTNKSVANEKAIIDWLTTESVTQQKYNSWSDDRKAMHDQLMTELLEAVDWSKTKDEIAKEIKSNMSAYVDGSKIKELAQELEVINAEPMGFFTEFAYAMVLDFPTNELDFSTRPRHGFWITPGIKFGDLKSLFKTDKKLGAVELMVYYRRLWDNYTGLETTNNDLGGRLVYTINKLSLSGEFIYREQKSVLSTETVNGITTTTSIDEEDSKVNFTLEYRVNSKVSFNYSIGQGFAINNLSGDPGLKAVAGFNYAFGGMASNTKIEEK